MVGDNIEALKRKEILRSEIDANKLEDLMTTKFATIDPEMALSDVVAKMKKEKLHEIPVVDGKKLSGRCELQHADPEEERGHGSEGEACHGDPAQGEGSRHPSPRWPRYSSPPATETCPSPRDPSIVGVVSRKDVVKLILDIKEIRNVQVQGHHVHRDQGVQEKSKIKEAMELMSKLDIRTIPVVDTDFRSTGIIGIRDIIDYSWGGSGTKSIKKGAYVPENNPVEITVSSLMHDSPITIGPSDTLGDAVKLMVKKNISTLPVVENDVLKGVITKYDVLEMIASVRIRDMVYMQISGLEEEDRLSLDVMEREIQNGLQKVAKITRPLMFSMHVHKYNNEGNTAKYSLNARLHTEYSTYTATAVDWNLMKATVDLMDKLEKDVTETKKVRVEKKRRGSK